jgi:hypothetical protein
MLINLNKLLINYRHLGIYYTFHHQSIEILTDQIGHNKYDNSLYFYEIFNYITIIQFYNCM